MSREWVWSPSLWFLFLWQFFLSLSQHFWGEILPVRGYPGIPVKHKLGFTLLSSSASLPADVMLVQPRVEFILSYIDHIAGDEDHTDVVVACAAGLIG